VVQLQNLQLRQARERVRVQFGHSVVREVEVAEAREAAERRGQLYEAVEREVQDL
jgi:hypothetical protein